MKKINFWAVLFAILMQTITSQGAAAQQAERACAGGCRQDHLIDSPNEDIELIPGSGNPDMSYSNGSFAEQFYAARRQPGFGTIERLENDRARRSSDRTPYALNPEYLEQPNFYRVDPSINQNRRPSYRSTPSRAAYQHAQGQTFAPEPFAQQRQPRDYQGDRRSSLREEYEGPSNPSIQQHAHSHGGGRGHRGHKHCGRNRDNQQGNQGYPDLDPSQYDRPLQDEFQNEADQTPQLNFPINGRG